MPWKASSVMDERLRFVARLLDCERMTDVCREFGNSPDFWLNVQRRTELREAMHHPKEQARIERAKPLSTVAD